MDVGEALRASPLFKGFTDTGIQILAGVASERVFPRGTPLFVENMIAESLFIVAEGSVRLTAKGSAGEEVSVGELGPGDFLGELSLIQQGQRMCTAVAGSPVTALEIRHSDFQKLLATKPQACLKLLMSICTLFGQKVEANREAIRTLLTKG